MTDIQPEHIQMLVQGATPIQIIIMIFLGIIALGIIVWIVKWIIDLRVGTLPQDIKEIKNSLNETNMRMTQMESKLWSHDDIAREISSVINQHMATCPARNRRELNNCQ